MRSKDSLNRSALWTAWDANTKVVRRTPKCRKLLRRIIKHQQKRALREQMRDQIEEGDI